EESTEDGAEADALDDAETGPPETGPSEIRAPDPLEPATGSREKPEAGAAGRPASADGSAGVGPMTGDGEVDGGAEDGGGTDADATAGGTYGSGTGDDGGGTKVAGWPIADGRPSESDPAA